VESGHGVKAACAEDTAAHPNRFIHNGCGFPLHLEVSWPMRFSPHLLDEIRARLPVSQVVGRRVALKKKGREFAGLSPFKVERTPSFFVNDQKGFYHCFASGEHGDIFTFLMKTEGLEFPEAVERLAAEAGVPLPKASERDEQAEDERTRLYQLLTASAAVFEAALSSAAGGEARRYLDGRGLKPETIAAFGLGYAAGGRFSLRHHLEARGFSSAEMARSGMQIDGPDIAEPYDRFRNRVMFPITDLKGRVIAFGGRALDKDAPAKYLNSPETPLFHKGHILFNAARARSAAHARERLIVVEGYMDVVALTEAGFPETVAPLGTALTEDQARLLWRMTPEPTLCFDGDSAGRKAAHRAIETVLPHLKPGFSVKFAFMPDGLDPDDMIRQQGSGAFRERLEQTRPLIDVLWDREISAGPIDTPEQRAALETRVRGLAQSIADPTVRAHYERELRDRLYRVGRQAGGGPPRASRQGEASLPGGAYTRPVQAPDWRNRERIRLEGRPSRGGRPGRFGGPGGAWTMEPAGPSAALSAQTQPIHPREALILKTLLNHAWLIDDYAEAIAELEFQSAQLTALRDEILTLHAMTNSLDSATLGTQLSKSGMSKVVDLVARTMTHNSDRFAEPEASATDVETAWRHILALQQRQGQLERALKSAEEAWYRDCTHEAESRLLDIKRQMATLAAGELADDAVPEKSEGGRA
jgi:DNA primase